MYKIFLIIIMVLNLFKKGIKSFSSCTLSDLFALYFNVLTFVQKLLTSYIKNDVNVYF